MDKLLQMVKDLESYIPKADLHANAVSKGTVGWHIDHALLTINVVLEGLKNSDPTRYEYKFNKWRTIIFTVGFFPRGKVQAPDSVVPKSDYTMQSLAASTVATRELLKNILPLDKNNYSRHPVFGKLNTKHTFTMLRMHTKHHIKIIRDIVGQVRIMAH